MSHGIDKPCLHCLIGRVIKTYAVEQKIGDANFIVDALADVMGDVLGSASNQPSDWSVVMTEFNMNALRRALESKKHWDEEERRAHGKAN